VATSGLRDRYKALLVSVARGDEFIQPQADTDFRPHDILWLVGSPDRLADLK